MKLVTFLVIVLSLTGAACGKKEDDPAKQQAALGLPAPAGPADEALGQIIVEFVSINEILGRVTSEETANAEIPALRQVIDRLSASLLVAQNLPDGEKERSRERYRERLDEETIKFSQNIGRIMQVPGAAPPVMNVLESMTGLSAAQPGTQADPHAGHDHGPGEGHDHPPTETPGQTPPGGGH